MQQAKKGKDDRGREAGQEEEEEEEEVHKTCMDQVRENRRTIESLLYIIFLILFTIYAMYAHGNTTDAFAFHQQVKNIFSPFLLVTSVDEWWTFMTGPFVNVSFPFRWYNGELLLPDDLGFVNMQFKPLGTINVRQLRVSSSSCKVSSRLSIQLKSCVSDFSSATEDRVPFGPLAGGMNKFVYKDSSEFGCGSSQCLFSGPITKISYPAGGYIVSLATYAETNTYTIARTAILQLKDDLFIDRYTSAVSVDLTLYNANQNSIAIVRLFLELPPGGPIYPTVDVSVVPVPQLYAGEANVAYLVLEGFVLGAVVLWSFNEIFKMYNLGMKAYLSRYWSYIDLLNLSLFYVSFSQRYGALGVAGSLKFPPDSNEFVSYLQPAIMVWRWKNIMGFNAIITWLKMLRYMGQVPFMTHLIVLFQATAEDVAWLVLIGVIVYMAFGLAFLLSYGDKMENFVTLSTNFGSLYSMTLGNFDMQALSAVNGYLGPFFVVTFTLLTTVMLLNMFMAIVINALSKVG